MQPRRVSAAPAVGFLCWADPSCLAADSSSAPAPARSGRTQTTPTPAILPCRANQCPTRAFKTSSVLPHHGHRREPASQQLAHQQPITLHWTAEVHVIMSFSMILHTYVLFSQTHIIQVHLTKASKKYFTPKSKEKLNI